MAAPEGNTNHKGKVWTDCLKRAIAQDDGKRLRAAAEKLLDACEKGDLAAISHIADRLEGKPGQNLTIGSDPENPFKIELERAKELEGKIRGLVVKDVTVLDKS